MPAQDDPLINSRQNIQNKSSDTARNANAKTLGTNLIPQSPPVNPNIADPNQYTPVINKAKTIQLYVGPYIDIIENANLRDYDSDKKTGINWGNWCDVTVNGFAQLPKNLWLAPSTLQFNIEIKNKFSTADINTVLEKMSSKVKNSNLEGLLSNINDGLEFAKDIDGVLKVGQDSIYDKKSDYQGATYIPKFQNLQAWDGMEPISYSFPSIEFKYGQYGYFNCLEEVVLPIMALCSIFLPTPAEDIKQIWRWSGPVPTLNVQLLTIIRSLVGQATNKDTAKGLKDAINGLAGGIKNAADNILSSDSAVDVAKNVTNIFSDSINTAIDLKDSIYQAFDNAAEDLLSKSKNKLAYFKISNAVMGPFYITEVKPTFDFSNVDQMGYPTKGSITFGGTKTPMLGTRDHLDIFGLKNNKIPTAAKDPNESATDSSTKS